MTQPEEQPAPRVFRAPARAPPGCPRWPGRPGRHRGAAADLPARADHAGRATSVTTVSSEELAAAAGVNSAKLRKDLSYLGSYGTRGVGYDVDYLVYQVSRELGLTQDWPVVIVGVGNLGHALANYGGFASRGFAHRGAGRRRPRDRGHRDRRAAPCARSTTSRTWSRTHGIAIGVIATPAAVAQEVCDRLVAAGVSSILNFAPVVLVVPDERRGAQGRPVDRAADPRLPRAAQGSASPRGEIRDSRRSRRPASQAATR